MEISLEQIEAAVQTAVREAVTTALAKFREPPPVQNGSQQRRPRLDQTLDFVRKSPGRKGIEIARGVFGHDATQPMVYGYLLRLEAAGLVIRTGDRPYRWFVANQ